MAALLRRLIGVQVGRELPGVGYAFLPLRFYFQGGRFGTLLISILQKRGFFCIGSCPDSFRVLIGDVFLTCFIFTVAFHKV
jgi:hypothetical protein